MTDESILTQVERLYGWNPTQLAYAGKKIVANMDPALQNGSVLINNSSLDNYMHVYAMSFVFFAVFFFGSDYMLRACCSDFYTSWGKLE